MLTDEDFLDDLDINLTDDKFLKRLIQQSIGVKRRSKQQFMGKQFTPRQINKQAESALQKRELNSKSVLSMQSVNQPEPSRLDINRGGRNVNFSESMVQLSSKQEDHGPWFRVSLRRHAIRQSRIPCKPETAIRGTETNLLLSALVLAEYCFQYLPRHPRLKQ